MFGKETTPPGKNTDSSSAPRDNSVEDDFDSYDFGDAAEEVIGKFDTLEEAVSYISTHL